MPPAERWARAEITPTPAAASAELPSAELLEFLGEWSDDDPLEIEAAVDALEASDE